MRVPRQHHNKHTHTTLNHHLAMLTGHQKWKHISTAQVSAWTFINISEGMGQCIFSRNHKTAFNSKKHFNMEVTKYVWSLIFWYICNMVHNSGYFRFLICHENSYGWGTQWNSVVLKRGKRVCQSQVHLCNVLLHIYCATCFSFT